MDIIQFKEQYLNKRPPQYAFQVHAAINQYAKEACIPIEFEIDESPSIDKVKVTLLHLFEDREFSAHILFNNYMDPK